MALKATITVNEVSLLEVDADPATAGGIAAAVGSIAVLSNGSSGNFWVKTGAGNTAWNPTPFMPSSTVLTTGSVPFANSSGYITQNNANLFWDNTNNRLGVGTATPLHTLHVVTSTVSGNGYLLVDGYGANAVGVRIRGAGGTSASPTAITSGTLFAEFTANGYGTSQFAASETGSIAFVAAETFTNTANGTHMAFYTTPTGSVAEAERLRVTAAGNLVTGSTGSEIYRTTNAGADVVAHITLDPANSLTSGNAFNFDSTNGMVLARANGTRRIARASFGITNNTDTAGSETSDLILSTKTAAGALTDRFKITSAGIVIVGSGAVAQDISGASAFPAFQILGTSVVQMAGIQYSADTIGPVFNLLKSRGASVNTQGLVSLDDEFGRIQFRASDGVNFQAGASIRALVDGTAAAGSMPGRLIFLTTPTGSVTPVERVRIDQSGSMTIGGVLGAALTNNPLSINGNVNNFLQSNVQNLSSGTTASSDIIATADTGTDTTNFINMGINSSGFTDATFTIAGALGGYLYTASSPISIGTGSANDVIFFTGGTLAANEKARIINSSGIFNISGGIRLGTTTDATNGNIRYNGLDVEFYRGTWRTMTFPKHIFDDFTWVTAGSGANPNDVITTLNTGGTGVTTGVVAQMAGVLQLGTGTTNNATGRASTYFNNKVTKYTLNAANPVTFEWRISVPVLATAGVDYQVRAGLMDGTADGAGDPVAGIFFTYNRATSANWIIVARSASTSSTTTTSVTVGAGTIYRLRAECLPGSVTYYIDSGSGYVNVGSASTNVPSVALNPFAKIEKVTTSTATSSLLNLDWFMINLER